MRTWLVCFLAVALRVFAAQGATITWTGGAGTENTEWSNGANWNTGTPPADATTDTIVFDNAPLEPSADPPVDTALNTVDAAEGTRTVGNLTFRNKAGTHVVDLDNNTLVVTGNLLVCPEDRRPRNSADVKFTNGVLQAGAAEIGTPDRKGPSGHVRLDGASLAVRGTVAVGSTGRVYVSVNGSSGGLDLADSSTLAVAGDGLISITFTTDQDEAEAGPYWGLRWKGDHLVELARLKSQSQLIFSVAEGVKGIAGLWYDGAADCTYVTVKEKWTPTAIARDLVVELPPGGTVTVHANDIDAGSYHAGHE